MAARRNLLLALLACGAARVLPGQDSPFAINGLGVPGRPESARARATGGAFAFFDPFSALTDVSVTANDRLSANAVGSVSYVTDDLDGVTATRRTTRFPLFQVSGPAWGGVVIGGGFSSYLDRSYRVTLTDTITLAGSQQQVTDVLSSDGGVSDLRVVAAKQFGPLAIGAGFHLLSGSTRLLASRTFTDTSSYSGVTQTDEIAFRGTGISASASLALGRSVHIAGFARSDTRLRSELNTVEVARNDLPTMFGAAVYLHITPQVALAGSVIRSNWSVAVDSNAFNTTVWSAGGEIGSGRHPLRIGVRSGQLPFGPGTTAPKEFTIAAGTGVLFAQGRGIIDVSLERQRRTGSGLTETLWTGLFGVTVRP
ncbi:MAG TPA: hypothetical protein VIW26_08710 [Gemmatimonadales bacterium]